MLACKNTEELPVTLHLWKRALKNMGLIISPVRWWMARWGRSAGKVSVWFGRRRRESLRGQISLWSVCWFHLSECRSAALLQPLWYHRPCRRRRNTVWSLGAKNQHAKSKARRSWFFFTILDFTKGKINGEARSETWDLSKCINSCLNCYCIFQGFFVFCLFSESAAAAPGFLLVRGVALDLTWPFFALLPNEEMLSSLHQTDQVPHPRWQRHPRTTLIQLSRRTSWGWEWKCVSWENTLIWSPATGFRVGFGP